MKAEYEARAASFDPTDYWNSHKHSLQRIAEEARQELKDKKSRKDYHKGRLEDGRVKKEEGEPEDKQHPAEAQASSPMDVETKPPVDEPYNPWEGDEMAKQLGETLDAFLSRLPPSTTAVAAGPWISIANPFSTQRPLQIDIAGFKTSGNELLEEFLNRKAKVEAKNLGKPPGSVTRALKADCEWLEKSIVDLAKSKGMTNGKWMLFPYANNVNETWRKVATGTLEGTLGCAAKVATDDGSGGQRLICIYTEDFTDGKDVRRVLDRMQELGLIRAEQGIYYKCDAYTYLNIMSGNEYRLKASMYSSKEMMKGTSAGRR